jgi:hypothetical protein
MLLERFQHEEGDGLQRSLKAEKWIFQVGLFHISDDSIEIQGIGEFAIKYDEVIIDPSFLFYLIFHKIKESEVIYYMPDNLLQLIDRSKENTEYRKFLKSFLSFFSNRFIINISEDDWYLFYDNIQKMNIKSISPGMLNLEEFKDYYEKYLNLFKDHSFFLSMSPKVNFLGDCIAKIMEFSRQRGTLILTKSRKLSDLLREKIICLELPRRIEELPKDLDKVLQAKSELLNKIFNFPGGRPTKFFIGLLLGLVGNYHPIIGGLGVAFVFVDP